MPWLAFTLARRPEMRLILVADRASHTAGAATMRQTVATPKGQFARSSCKYNATYPDLQALSFFQAGDAPE
jgi:hypothetical protein